MPDGRFISVSEIAALAQISERKARAAISKVATKQTATWRGAALHVRMIGGVAGGCGGIAYEVAADSLPPDLFLKWQQRQTPDELPPLLTGGSAVKERQWWLNFIMPILSTEPLSAARGKLVRELAAQQHVYWDGKLVTFCTKSIYRRVNDYRDSGYAALSRKPSGRIGKPLCLISRRWQNKCGLSLEKKAEIYQKLRDYVRQLHKAGEHRRGIIFRARLRLFELTTEAGSTIAQEDCEVSRWFTDRERHYRRVNRFQRDRKAHEDAKPRIMRSHENMMPMDLVFGDVHHLDFDLTTVEGYQSTVKSVAWYDFATGRIHLTLFRLPSGKGIRNEHVIDSFMSMVAAWGLPKQLYLDNGGEFNFAAFIDDALRLRRNGLEWIGAGSFERDSHVLRAKPYNASAKPIEGAFNILTNHIFPSLPGWRGGVLGSKKTPNVNRAVSPFTGSFDEFGQMLQGALLIQQNLPQGGKFLGKSPNDLLREAIAAGWRKTEVSPELFAIAFCDRETRKIDSGAISYGGRRWRCDEIDAYLHDRVVILAPKYTSFGVLPLEDLRGNLIGFAKPEIAFHPLDPAGAKEAARRQTVHNAAIRQLGRMVPDLDVVADNRRIAALLPSAPDAPSGDRITPTSDAQKIIDALSGVEPEPKKRPSTAARLAQIERLNSKRRGVA